MGGEIPLSWQVWSDGAGGDPTIIGDQDWGKIELEKTEIGHSSVMDLANTDDKLITVTYDEYEAGSGGLGTIYIRGQATVFDRDAVSPSWEEYTGPVNHIWRWMQVKLVF